MAVPLTTVVSDPDWIPHALDAAGGNLAFVHVPRGDRSELTFLSDEHYKGRYPKGAYPFSQVASALPDAETPPAV